MRVLNLYSGLGGNRALWKDVDVTAVEKDPKIARAYRREFPDDTVIVADAHQYLLDHFDEFDFIWSSPECQSHSLMIKCTKHDIRRYPDLRLYEEILFLKHFFKGKYVVENIDPYYKPLIPAQRVDRHLFWANFKIGSFQVEKPDDFINTTDHNKLAEWLGINYPEKIYYNGNNCASQVLRNCVHPKIGEHILNRVREIKVKSNTKQTELKL